MGFTNYYYFKNPQQLVAEAKHQIGFNNVCDFKVWRFIKELVGAKVGMFHYDNLPDGLKTRDIELALTFTTNLCLYKHTALNKILLCSYTNANDEDAVNQYLDPNEVYLQSLNGKTLNKIPVPFENVIPVRDNTLNLPPIFTIYDYISILVEIEKTMDLNVKLLRFPMLFKGNEKDVASVNKIFKNIADFKPYMVIDKQLANGIEANKMELNYDPTQIYELEDKFRQLAYSSIGIYGADKKRERLITAEIESSNDITDTIYQDMLINRQEFVNELNKRYNLNVVLRESYAESQKDSADLEAYKEKKIADADAQAEIKVAKVTSKPEFETEVKKGGSNE